MESKVCPACGKTFTRAANVSRWSWAKRETCSRSCKAKLQWKKAREERAKPCERCGKSFVGRPASRFCSKRCSSMRGRRPLPICACGCGESTGDHRSTYVLGHLPSDAPVKRRAHHAVKNALRHGGLTKPDHCEDCGRQLAPRLVHGHHKSYEKDQWLVVDWLCHQCHKNRHAKGEGNIAPALIA